VLPVDQQLYSCYCCKATISFYHEGYASEVNSSLASPGIHED